MTFSATSTVRPSSSTLPCSRVRLTRFARRFHRAYFFIAPSFPAQWLTRLLSDAANTAAINSAENGIAEAEKAIGNIALSILLGKIASPTDRQHVSQGLTAVGTGLSAINSQVFAHNLHQSETEMDAS